MTRSEFAMFKTPMFSQLASANLSQSGPPGLPRRDAYLPWAGANPPCCEPAAGAVVPPRPQRLRLKDLPASMHCSVIGTCLAADELRSLVARCQGLAPAELSELDVHHGAVELAQAAGAGAKALHKLLDQRHALALQRFARLATPEALAQAWHDSVQQADIAGPYWALLTHPQTTPALRQQAFGEVHMLSHLQGASARADLARLQALERDNAALTQALQDQQARWQTQQHTHQQAVQTLSEQLTALQLQALRPAPAADAALLGQLQGLRQAHDQALQALQALQGRERALRGQQAEWQVQGERQARSEALIEALQAELRALELVLEDAAAQAPERPGADWVGRRILYVGGRPSTHNAIRRQAQALGIGLAIHDGGLEDRKGLLPALVPGSDLVLLPVDCVDHDSMNRLKRLCARHGVRFQPLRSAGVASFLAALGPARVPRSDSVAAPRPLCLRHA